MTDKKIDSWLDRINNEGSFLLIKEIDGASSVDQKVKIFSENIDISYLDKSLGLVVVLLDKNKSGNIVKLSKKGIEVVNKGGWIKYKSDKETKKRKEKIKKEFSYWIGIIIPFLMLMIALNDSKKDEKSSLENKAHIINEVKESQKEQIEKEVYKHMETMSKSWDSVLLVIEQKNLSD